MNKIFFYFLALNLPNLIAVTKHQDHLMTLVISICFTALLLIFIRNTKNFFLLIPFFILMPLAAYYTFYYDSSIDEFAFSVILDTNLVEVKSFFGDILYLIAASFIIWIGLVLYIFLIKKNSGNIEVCGKPEHRVFCGIIIAALFLTGFYTPKPIKAEYLNIVKETFPLGFILNGYNFSKEMSRMKKTRTQIKNFKFGATQPDISEKQIVVLVIGETGRRDNWQLNGYSRNTTPLLAKQANLLNGPDMLSLAPATIVSIPMMITRKPEANLYKYYFDEPSVLKAFKEVGFKTYWISTQQEVSSFDSLTSAYAEDADKVVFSNHTVSKTERDMDDVLIPEFNKILSSPEQKQFIVIHTLGSHQQYNRRNPLSFNRFRPSLDDVNEYNPQSIKYKQHSLNSYDNTVVFTDYVLNAFIEQLKAKNALSFMFYAADHGEDLFDGKCDKSGHGNSTVYNFKVPAFVWVSDEYKKYFPDKFSALKENINKKINHTSIFPTLVDSMSLQIPHYSADRSLLSELKPYNRLVLNQIDYDHTNPVGRCLELDNLH